MVGSGGLRGCELACLLSIHSLKFSSGESGDQRLWQFHSGVEPYLGEI